MLHVALRLLALSAAVALCSARAQPIIGAIWLDQREVFDSTTTEWFFAAPLLNTLHTTTRPWVIGDELLFAVGDRLDTTLLYESERNLRRTGLFSRVAMHVDTVAPDTVEVTITTQDFWSTSGALLFGSGGGVATLGAELEEFNLAGTGSRLGASGIYRTENNIGWQGALGLTWRRALRSELTLAASLFANRVRTEQRLALLQPYRTLRSPLAWSLGVTNLYGSDFLYQPGSGRYELLPFHLRRASGWISIGTTDQDEDRLFATLLLSVEHVRRIAPEFRQAGDNSARVLLSLGSLRQRFRRMSGLDGYLVEDLASGAWGAATVGYFFPANPDGERFFYVGGEAEQSGFLAGNRLYLFGRISAGSGFEQGQARYTSIESEGLGHWRFSPLLVLVGRFWQQTVWNWTAFRQLVLDNDAGLRSYAVNQLIGDNRLLYNIELRAFPTWQWWIFRFSGVAFLDGGTVWRQGMQFDRVRFHHAVGVGVRLHILKWASDGGILRFDVAYNLDTRRIGFVFSSNQLFSAVRSHQFQLPTFFGSAIDTE
ncbi:MAG: hypothetical protein KatS3mg040_0025 [Candidatus Kapaibacterium sp.]|nr:MAG: hypothetical protein KatS3mg040_0025 [Candidatus Kapabacteria bacterium]